MQEIILDKEYTGRIIKGIGGFYYVYVPEVDKVFECKAKGIFRKDGLKPLVGDLVKMVCIDVEKILGNISELLPREVTLLRPAVANVDQALIVFALKKPEPNFNVLDRFIIMMQQQNLPCIICFNKEDIATEEEIESVKQDYSKCGCECIVVSTKENLHIDRLKEMLSGKTTAIAGPSGVGKSTLVNLLTGSEKMETGEISKKLDRGKHTTRHSELMAVTINDKLSFVMDTPGFTSLYVLDEDEYSISSYYREFDEYRTECKFNTCLHINEPKCGVKAAVEAGKISRLRYNNYCKLYEEEKNKKRY